MGLSKRFCVVTTLPCGLIVYYAVRADSEFFTCLSRKKPCEYEKHYCVKSQAQILTMSRFVYIAISKTEG